MKRFVFLFAVLLAFGLVLPAPVALAEDYTYVGAAFGTWPNQNNWRDHNNQINGYPDDLNDKATVATGKSVLVTVSDITVGVIDVQTGVSGDGVIGIEGERMLSLGNRDGSSTVNGRIEFRDCYLCSSGTLAIVASTTLTGSGTVLAGNHYTGLVGGYINTASGQTLTSDVVLEGQLRIPARLTNNGSVKVANASDTLELTTNNKDGSGDWICDAGLLDVYDSIELGGTGDWLISDDDADNNSVVRFSSDVELVNTTGNFVIFGGVLDADTDICTTGDLTFEDPDVTDVDTRIIIRVGSGATFNASSCP